MTPREQADPMVPSQTHQCYWAATGSEHRARGAAPRKAPSGTHDPSGPASSPKGHTGSFLISGFAQIHLAEANNPSNTFPPCKTQAAICSCNGLGLDLPPNKEVSQNRWAEKGTPAPHHAPYPGRSEPSVVSHPAPDRSLPTAVHPSADVSQMW